MATRKELMVSVKFLREVRPKDGSGTVFDVDSIHELSRASAEHWIRRGAAVECEQKIQQKQERVNKKSLIDEKI